MATVFQRFFNFFGFHTHPPWEELPPENPTPSIWTRFCARIAAAKHRVHTWWNGRKTNGKNFETAAVNPFVTKEGNMASVENVQATTDVPTIAGGNPPFNNGIAVNINTSQATPSIDSRYYNTQQTTSLPPQDSNISTDESNSVTDDTEKFFDAQSNILNANIHDAKSSLMADDTYSDTDAFFDTQSTCSVDNSSDVVIPAYTACDGNLLVGTNAEVNLPPSETGSHILYSSGTTPEKVEELSLEDCLTFISEMTNYGVNKHPILAPYLLSDAGYSMLNALRKPLELCIISKNTSKAIETIQTSEHFFPACQAYYQKGSNKFSLGTENPQEFLSDCVNVAYKVLKCYKWEFHEFCDYCLDELSEIISNKAFMFIVLELAEKFGVSKLDHHLTFLALSKTGTLNSLYPTHTNLP